jgi:flagellar protein FlbD
VPFEFLLWLSWLRTAGTGFPKPADALLPGFGTHPAFTHSIDKLASGFRAGYTPIGHTSVTALNLRGINPRRRRSIALNRAPNKQGASTGAPETTSMIWLTRLNSHPLAINSDLIKTVEQAPDTVLTLVNGEKIIVRESAQEVLSRVLTFRRSILRGIFPVLDRIGAASPQAEVAEEQVKR